jgi:hypothetical protein
MRRSILLHALTVVCVTAPAAVAVEIACAAVAGRYGAHPLTLAGAIALEAKAGSPTDQDLLCLEQVWTPGDGAIAATATRALLLLAARHPGLVIKAATARPKAYREWLADWDRYGIHDVSGEGPLLREGTRALERSRVSSSAEEATRRWLVAGFRAAKSFKLD